MNLDRSRLFRICLFPTKAFLSYLSVTKLDKIIIFLIYYGYYWLHSYLQIKLLGLTFIYTQKIDNTLNVTISCLFSLNYKRFHTGQHCWCLLTFISVAIFFIINNAIKVIIMAAFFPKSTKVLAPRNQHALKYMTDTVYLFFFSILNVLKQFPFSFFESL